MVETVMVAVDGGTASDAALNWSLDRAAHLDVRLDVTTVIEPDGHSANETGDSYRIRRERALVSSVARIAPMLPHHVIEKSVIYGHVVDALVKASRDADLLVVGNHPTSLLAGMVHGTLPLRLAGQTRCTTVVVPSDWRPSGFGVVVAWDDDSSADSALMFAASEASRRLEPLTIVHSFTVPSAQIFDADGATLVFDEALRYEHIVLAEAAITVRRAYPQLVVREVLAAGPAAVEAIAAAHGAALLVVGTHSRGAAGFLLGSVSHAALINMPAPVAVVPASREPIDILPEVLDEELL